MLYMCKTTIRNVRLFFTISQKTTEEIKKITAIISETIIKSSKRPIEGLVKQM